MDIRTFPAGQSRSWLHHGYALFNRAPLSWMAIVVFYMGAIVVLENVPPLLGKALSSGCLTIALRVLGFITASVVGTVLVGGIMQGCKDLDEGRGLHVSTLFAASGGRAKSLMLLAGIQLLALFFMLAAVSAVMAWAGLSSIFLRSGLSSGQLPAELSHLPPGTLLTGLLFALPLAWLLSVIFYQLVIFVPALIMLRRVGLPEALRLSMQGGLGNMTAFLMMGLRFMLYGMGLMIPMSLLMVALAGIVSYAGGRAAMPFVPLLMGACVVPFFSAMMATVFGAHYTAYKDIFQDAAAELPG